MDSSNSSSSSAQIVELSKKKTVETDQGVLKIQPYRSSTDQKLKALITFTPRHSGLDRFNEQANSDTFRGFYVLFWFGLALLFARSTLHSWRETRTLLSLTFGRLITRDMYVLALSDAVLVASMLVCVPFAQGLKYRYYTYWPVGALLQNLWQCIFLGTAVWWGFHRKWFWTQAGFLVLHALSSLMKMHSWCSTNGMFADIYFKMKSQEKHLERLLSEAPNGGEDIRQEAASREKEEKSRIERERRTSEDSLSSPPVGTPSIPTGTAAFTTSYISPADNLRHGLLSTAKGRSSRSSSLAGGANLSPSIKAEAAELSRAASLDPLTPNPLVALGLEKSGFKSESDSIHHHAKLRHTTLTFSSEERISTLATNIETMRAEITGTGPDGLMWPNNITYRHFIDFMLLPTLVYELEYPRTPILRPLYILEKVFATFGVFSLIYIVTEYYIVPFMPKPEDSLIDTFINLALPMMINYLLIFYIIFECVCNAFAEITHFADREFYQDWWNSTNMEVYSRKWNKPVHTFLLRHVYASTISTWRTSRFMAQFVTFLLSALCHELVMAVVTKKIRMYLFAMQMVQLPMIMVSRIPFVKRNQTLGNIVFWMGLMSGFPLLAILYMVY